MTARVTVWWKCYLSLSILFAFRAISSLSTFPIFRATYHWDRLDQGNLLSAEAWGCLLACFIGAFAVRTVGSKVVIIIAHLWQAYFSLFHTSMSFAYYDLWTNKFFSSMADGIIFIAVFHTLLFWLPSNELLSHFYLLSSAVGVGFISGILIVWTCFMIASWQLSFGFMVILTAVAAYQWYSPSVSSYPCDNTKIPKTEQNYIQSNCYKVNRKGKGIYSNKQRYTDREEQNCADIGRICCGILNLSGLLLVPFPMVML